MYNDEAQATEAYTHSYAQTMPSQICSGGRGLRGPRRALGARYRALGDGRYHKRLIMERCEWDSFKL